MHTYHVDLIPTRLIWDNRLVRRYVRVRPCRLLVPTVVSPIDLHRLG